MADSRGADMIRIDGQDFADEIAHFSFAAWHQIRQMHELEKLVGFKQLVSASFSGTGLDDAGLALICRVATLENLDLQDTCVTDRGIGLLTQLPALRILRLKENPQLTNACLPALVRLKGLVELQLHESAIDQAGLPQLAALNQLRDLCLDADNTGTSPEAVLSLSRQLPRCRILVKGRGEALGGAFQGHWPA
ncbi:MAG: hypothetical protein CVV27_06455 [Candidatus Melainabacteria bacterium HGW-Melainabacteria-1]|nr:MAG: hypothetical protein CVV27_06455 [Candidatus Melainabacteria bacterium HGW-Melainabacteria-1]